MEEGSICKTILREEENSRTKFGVIRLSVLIPHCQHCRERVAELLHNKYWKSVIVGYPLACGTTVELLYDRAKYPQIDFLRLAERGRMALEDNGYHVF